MAILAGEVPRESSMHPGWTTGASYRDSFRMPLASPDAGPVEIFMAIFADRPALVKLAFRLRNTVARRLGLTVPADGALLVIDRTARYSVGDTIGSWPIYALTADELVAGRDNAHLDFRVSILKIPTKAGADLAVSTVCKVHNRFGKLYLAAITPFHRLGLRWLLRRAAAAGRL